MAEAKAQKPITGHVHCDVEGCTTPDVPIRGSASPAMMLGLHKKNAHGITGSSSSSTKARATRPKKGPTGLDAGEKPTPLRIVGEMGDELDKREGAPSVDELTRVLGKGYGLAATWGWSAAVEGDPRYDEAARYRIVEELAPTPGEAAATVHPIARALAGLEVTKKYGRSIVKHSDVLDAGYAIAEQLRRMRTYFAERSAYERALQSGHVTPLVAAATSPAPATAQPPAPSPGTAPGQTIDALAGPMFAPPPTAPVGPVDVREESAVVPGIPAGAIVTPEMLGRPNVTNYEGGT